MVDIDGDSLIKGLNKTGENYKSEIFVVTMDDNLTHPYFSNIQLDKDNVTPIGSCILTAPRENELAQYWLNYTGPVVVSFKMQDIEHENTNTEDYFKNKIVPAYTKYQEKLEKKAKALAEKNNEEYKKKELKEIKQNLINNYYNFSFIGKVNRIKERGKTFIIYLSDLGWKFMQKVPKEFRNAYVAGQSLDDAFQAMCEFMGIEFAYSIEDLNEYSFSADGYSVEKDGSIIEDVPQILKEWSNNAMEEKVESLTQQLDKKESNNQSEENKDNSNKNNSNNLNANKKISDTDSPIYKNTNQDTDKMTNSDEEKDKDKQKTLEDKKAEYQEDFDEKIRTLFIGNGYYPSDLTHPILNYDSITIEPKAPETSSSNMSTMGNTNMPNANSSEQDIKEYWRDKLQNSDIGLKLNIVDNSPRGNLQKGIYLLGR